MDHRKHNQTDSWDNRVYGIGNTMPPKAQSGMVTLLLILVIFLSGIISALSFLNIKLFQELNHHKQNQDAPPMSFTGLVPDPTSGHHPIGPTPPFSGQENVTISLNQSPQSVENIPEEGSLSWQEVYEKNIPSVVSIISSGNTGTMSGSGIILSSRGHILTNYHLIDGAETISVRFHDGVVMSGMVIGADAVTDLALVYVDTQGLTPAEFGDSSSLRVGDPVAVIGNPSGADLPGSMTDGIVSAISQDTAFNGHSISLIRTSADLGSGHAGGPLLNCYGQVVGINTLLITADEQGNTLNVVNVTIPSTTIKDIVDQLLTQGYVSGRPTLGITVEAISRFDQFYFHLPAGMYVTAVEAPGPFEQQLLEPGDILMSLNGITLTTQNQLDAMIHSSQVGDTLEALVYRDGEELTLTLTVLEHKG